MVEEESDDTEAVVKLLELNDIINITIERYNLVKKGDLASAAALPLQSPMSPRPGPPRASAPSKKQEVSLIDFDGDANGGETSAAGPSTSAKPEDDLLGLSFNDAGSSSSDLFGSGGGGIALGFGANTSKFIQNQHLLPLFFFNW